MVINLDVVDSHDEALVAAPHALKLCEMIDASEDWECECDEIMDKFAEEAGRRPIYTVCFYQAYLGCCKRVCMHGSFSVMLVLVSATSPLCLCEKRRGRDGA